MAERRPLVRDPASGRLRELDPGDHLPGLARACVRRPDVHWVAGDATCLALGGMTLTANIVQAVPFVLPRSATLSGLRMWVTFSSGGRGELGIYANTDEAASDAPGILLAKTGSVAWNTTGEKGGNFTTGALTLAPGRLYWAAVASNGSPSVRAVPLGALASVMGRRTGTDTASTSVSISFSGGTLPATAPAGSTVDGVAPAIYLVRA